VTAAGEPGPVLSELDARRLDACLADGGVAVLPTDTVYGLACDPEQERAVRRLYALKGRAPDKPAAVMFFALTDALAALPELAAAERAAAHALLPGAVTLLLPNRARRFRLACVPGDVTLGLRVPRLDAALAALAFVTRPMLQSSANLAGRPEARRVRDVPDEIRAGAWVALDGGERPGRASTVVDLGDFAERGEWRVVRDGAVARADLARALSGVVRRS
jgi:L-threonylcarbamoyladenylate synthase